MAGVGNPDHFVGEFLPPPFGLGNMILKHTPNQRFPVAPVRRWRWRRGCRCEDVEASLATLTHLGLKHPRRHLGVSQKFRGLRFYHTKTLKNDRPVSCLRFNPSLFQGRNERIGAKELEAPKPETATTYFASSNPHPPHSRAYDREHGCANSSMVFERLGAYDCSTSFAVSNSTCV